jgi:hypothetical protein
MVLKKIEGRLSPDLAKIRAAITSGIAEREAILFPPNMPPDKRVLIEAKRQEFRNTVAAIDDELAKRGL